MNLRTAVGHASIEFLLHPLQLKNNPRRIAWTAIILTEWENPSFEQRIADAFEKIDFLSSRSNWREDDFDRLTEILLTRKTLHPSTISLLRTLPENKDPHMLNRTLAAAEGNTSPSVIKGLIDLLRFMTPSGPY